MAEPFCVSGLKGNELALIERVPNSALAMAATLGKVGGRRSFLTGAGDRRHIGTAKAFAPLAAIETQQRNFR